MHRATTSDPSPALLCAVCQNPASSHLASPEGSRALLRTLTGRLPQPPPPPPPLQGSQIASLSLRLEPEHELGEMTHGVHNGLMAVG